MREANQPAGKPFTHRCCLWQPATACFCCEGRTKGPLGQRLQAGRVPTGDGLSMRRKEQQRERGCCRDASFHAGAEASTGVQYKCARTPEAHRFQQTCVKNTQQYSIMVRGEQADAKRPGTSCLPNRLTPRYLLVSSLLLDTAKACKRPKGSSRGGQVTSSLHSWGGRRSLDA